MVGNPVRMTQDWLKKWCARSVSQLTPAQAYGVAAGFKNLAIWWLRPEVLHLAAEHARTLELVPIAQRWEASPQLPTDRGACWIALVNKYPNELGLLRESYALPLRWRQESEHDRRLPAGLLDLADQVRTHIEGIGEVSGTWTLHAASDSLLEGLDLCDLEGQWDSAWVSLAVGLLLAAWEGTPDPTIWASAAWDSRQGIKNVDGLEAKLVLASELGAKVFCVPEQQADNLRSVANENGVEIVPLPNGVTDFFQVSIEYLERLDQPIGPGPHLKQKRAEYFTRIQDNNIALRFYRRYVLPDVAEDLRRQLPRDLDLRHKKLIMIVSKSFDLIKLAILLIEPSQCLVLYNRELEGGVHDIKQMILQESPECEVKEYLFQKNNREDLLAELRDVIGAFASNSDPRDLVFDCTAGTKLMSLCLYDAAPLGSYVICVSSEFDQQRRRPKPGTERLDVWRVEQRGNG